MQSWSLCYKKKGNKKNTTKKFEIFTNCSKKSNRQVERKRITHERRNTILHHVRHYADCIMPLRPFLRRTTSRIIHHCDRDGIGDRVRRRIRFHRFVSFESENRTVCDSKRVARPKSYECQSRRSVRTRAYGTVCGELSRIQNRTGKSQKEAVPSEKDVSRWPDLPTRTGISHFNNRPKRIFELKNQT